jgi:hypothetical protein
VQFIKQIFLLLALTLSQLHAMVPHTHHQEANANCTLSLQPQPEPAEQNLLHWFSDIFHFSQGEDHLENFQKSSEGHLLLPFSSFQQEIYPPIPWLALSFTTPVFCPLQNLRPVSRPFVAYAGLRGPPAV